MNQIYFEGKELTKDWVSARLKSWELVLEPNRQQPLKVLEVGAFEGRSVIFFMEYLPNAQIVCIDTFEGGEEHRDVNSPHYADMQKVEQRFDKNVAPYGDRVEKLKGASIEMLLKLREEKRTFDVVYIDGDHHASAVFLDARMAWDLMSEDGIMILDDYLWPGERSEVQRPKAGIDAFLKTIEEQYEELLRDYQIIIRKGLPKLISEPLTIGGQPLDKLSAGGVRPPLVSFVIINWNYGGYVGQTIDSIKAQDYPYFECLVINNGSTDNSNEVIERHIRGDERFRSFSLEKNLGQLGAAFWSLDKVSGGFVTFVDADDVLFKNFASTHLQVHMALPKSVGFTSSGVVEMDSQGNSLTSSYGAIDLNRKQAVKGLRDSGIVLRFPAINDEKYARLNEDTATIPRWTRGWLWGPGTANMFRKSILELTRMGDGNKAYMRASDTHFNFLCHAFVGSALITSPLSGYRIHGQNYFTSRENIQGINKLSPALAKKQLKESYESVEGLLINSEKLSWVLGNYYWNVLDQCAEFGNITLQRYFQSIEGEAIFIRQAPLIRQVFGNETFVTQIVSRFNYSRAKRIITEGFNGTVPLSISVKLASNKVRRKFRSLNPLKKRN